MIGDIAIVRRPKRKTHIAISGNVSMCNVRIAGEFTLIEMIGGARNRVINNLRREFNDETCCKRCTAIVAMLVICYATRDKGKVFING